MTGIEPSVTDSYGLPTCPRSPMLPSFAPITGRRFIGGAAVMASGKVGSSKGFRSIGISTPFEGRRSPNTLARPEPSHARRGAAHRQPTLRLCSTRFQRFVPIPSCAPSSPLAGNREAAALWLWPSLFVLFSSAFRCAACSLPSSSILSAIYLHHRHLRASAHGRPAALSGCPRLSHLSHWNGAFEGHSSDRRGAAAFHAVLCLFSVNRLRLSPHPPTHLRLSSRRCALIFFSLPHHGWCVSFICSRVMHGSLD